MHYDIIFADPPYAYEHYDRLIEAAADLKFTLFVLEYGSESHVTAGIEGYDVTDKKVGAVNFKIFVSNQ